HCTDEKARISTWAHDTAKRAIWLEPTTLSLLSALTVAWLSGNRIAKPKSTRSNPLETAASGWSLARNWRATPGVLIVHYRIVPAKSRSCTGALYWAKSVRRRHGELHRQHRPRPAFRAAARSKRKLEPGARGRLD